MQVDKKRIFARSKEEVKYKSRNGIVLRLQNWSKPCMIWPAKGQICDSNVTFIYFLFFVTLVDDGCPWITRHFGLVKHLLEHV